MKIKCIAVDDEPLALRVIQSHVEKLDDVELVATCSNALDAFQLLRKHKVDLILLDIQMPELNGIQFLKSLENPPAIVFTTAYRNYAIEAFDLNVLDYLLKPISFSRFLKTINRFHAQNAPKQQSPKNVQVNESTEKAFIFVKRNKTMIKVMLDDICYIESLKDYVRINTGADKMFVKYRISKIEEELPEDKFIRIHKSYIVSVNRIESLSPTSVGIAGDKLPIGRSYKEMVLRRLNYYSE